MISLQHIGVQFGQHTVLEGIHVDIADGRLTALMGPNGCGKTTLLRCIGGLLRPTRGEVFVDGTPIRQLSARQMAQQVAMVRQQTTADFDFTAFETVLMGRNPYQRRLQRESQTDLDIVEQAMRQTATWPLRDRYPSQLSGGELQRVMIARALAQQTPVLLMDEPVSNLDIAHQLEVMRLLRGLGKTVVIVLHDLALARHFCDDLLLLHHHHLVYSGPMTDGLTPDRIAQVYGVSTHLEASHLVYDYEG